MAADDGKPEDGKRGEENEQLLGSAFLYGGNAAYLEQMQAAYAKNPGSVPVSYTHLPSPRDQRGSRMPSSA